MDPIGNEVKNSVAKFITIKFIKLNNYFHVSKSSIFRRALPAELINELFGSLPFHNAFRLLTKMPNGLLARNVQKMPKNIKMAMKENKLDEMNCGRGASISEDGLIATSIYRYYNNLVQAVSPIPPFILRDLIIKPTIVFYFEMQILCQPAEGRISIGFEIPYSIRFGILSIKISHKGGMKIDESFYNFENGDEDFVEGDFVGLGIIHHPDRKMECFATCNDKLLGKATLPPVYQHFKLFPTVRLYTIGDSIRMNFGKDEWQFKKFGLVLS